MNIVFTPIAWEQYTDWQKEDKKIIRRINELIKDIDRQGLLKGIGKPEAFFSFYRPIMTTKNLLSIRFLHH